MIRPATEGNREQKLAAYREVCDGLLAAHPQAVFQGRRGERLDLSFRRKPGPITTGRCHRIEMLPPATRLSHAVTEYADPGFRPGYDNAVVKASPSDRFRAQILPESSHRKIRMLGRPKFVLASGSPRRLGLLNQAGIEPDALRPADVDETPKRGELPRACANRLARAKADAALKSVQLDDELRGAFILAADTVVAVGRRILPKANLVDEASQCLRLLSGRNHRVYTAICLVTPKEAFRQRLVETRVRFKRLSEDDIQAYIGSGEWRGKAGGYAVQGIAGSFVVKMVGSYTNIVGLPLYESISAARRRRVSDPLRLVECRLSRKTTRRRASRARSAASRLRRKPRCRSARARCRDVDLNRWLSGSYVVPGAENDEEDAE